MSVPQQNRFQREESVNDWRCECGVRLGVMRGNRVEIRLEGYQYVATKPVDAVCRKCKRLNVTE